MADIRPLNSPDRILMRPLAIVSLALAAAPLAAQQSMAGMDHSHMTPPASAKTQAEIASVAKALTKLSSPGAAGAAGFQPEFGWLATMGIHWVDESRMSKAAQSSVTAPNNLMFSKINGRDSLVGAAYAYVTAENDSVVPKLFDGAPMWHDHPNLAPPGMRLTMLHVWFVASPDGPFAGTNPNLPFWAVGLAAPDPARMHDTTFSSRIRRAALALADAVDSASVFPRMALRADVQVMMQPRRDSIRALVPELLAAEKKSDTAAWDRGAERLATLWDHAYAAYLDAARPANREPMKRQVAMLLGQHVH